ncbi:MAG: class II fructose-bisphosphate aldolase [Eubacteriales bacterium]|nr:class II fructose-bisphosphate aldolase [Eubacteriales bacterium]
MPIANMRDLLAEARREKRAVGSFSVSSINMIMGIVNAAEQLHTPVILQVAEKRLRDGELAILGAAMLAAAKQSSQPIGVHLDHGETIECIRRALELGFTSVMYDGSRLPLEENICQTNKVMELARPFHAAVEAEIGSVGKTETGQAAPAICAKPEEGVHFLKETGVDALAVAIGNAHGVYVGAPHLRFEVLEEMLKSCDTPFVLHGGTGISDADFHRAAQLGMLKINIATATFMAATQAAQGAQDYFEMIRRIEAAAEQVAMHHIRIFGVKAKEEV